MTGINAINSPLYIANYTDSTPRMTLYGGTTDVTGNGYLKFWNYNTSSQRIQIARSGTNTKSISLGCIAVPYFGSGIPKVFSSSFSFSSVLIICPTLQST